MNESENISRTPWQSATDLWGSQDPTLESLAYRAVAYLKNNKWLGLGDLYRLWTDPNGTPQKTLGYNRTGTFSSFIFQE